MSGKSFYHTLTASARENSADQPADQPAGLSLQFKLFMTRIDNRYG